MNTMNKYSEYVAIMQQIADFQHAAAMLEWDQEVYMPKRGAQQRARQLSTLATAAHELATSSQLGQLLQDLAGQGSLTPTEKSNVLLSLEDYNKHSKLPSSFVSKLSMQTSVCYNAWLEARNSNDFKVFAPHLADMVALKLQQAQYFGYEQHPYDALLNEYEKGATVQMLDPIFQGLKEQLPALLQQIVAKPQVDNQCLLQHFPKQQQWDFSIQVLQDMGYDFEAGRQDYAAHPFTTSFGSQDVRITTRVDEHDFASLFWSTVHEGGHALYEQGLPAEQYGLPLGVATSLGIHESQSRLWENNIARGLNFWKHYFPKLQQIFPKQLGDCSLQQFYNALNKVAPSFIRTEADELTYHFHVMIRYEVEKAILSQSVAASDMQQLWNDSYSKYLGIRPEHDNQGILQDVHWSHGSFGYFPTYSLGSFYAVQLINQARLDINNLDEQVESGTFGALKTWLQQNVHQYGRQYTSNELCKRITGSPLDVTHFIRYATDKYGAIYNF